MSNYWKLKKILNNQNEYIEMKQFKLTDDENFLINCYDEEIAQAVAMCDFYHISYESYFKEPFLYRSAYKLKSNLPKDERLLLKWQFMKIYLELHEKFNIKILQFYNISFIKMIDNIRTLILYIDSLFNSDIIKLRDARKEAKKNEKKVKDKEYCTAQKAKENL